MFSLFKHTVTFPKGGVHPKEEKISAGQVIRSLPLPKMVTIPIVQHIGAPANLVVEKGDTVKTGQVIAQIQGVVSANVHASASGKVAKIEESLDASGYKHTAVTIRVKDDLWEEGIDRSETLVTHSPLTGPEIIRKIQEAGIVGMGGAAFPSHVKLSVPEGKHAEYLIVNGVECEPYLTADHQLMVEKTCEIFVGTQLLMRALGASKAIIGIEANKPDAIYIMKMLTPQFKGIEVKALAVKYPQGGEKQLIKALLNREVPRGKLPIDVGAVVQNVGTTFAVYEAVMKNKPLIERIVTVSGKDVPTPGNFRVRIGTPVSDLLEAVGGLPEGTGKVVNGGPMMGKALASLEVPVTKATSGIVCIPDEAADRGEVYACIRCGKCVEVCPMGLEPYWLSAHVEQQNFAATTDMVVTDCIECGSCSYECPSNRPLLDQIRLAKVMAKKVKHQPA